MSSPHVFSLHLYDFKDLFITLCISKTVFMKNSSVLETLYVDREGKSLTFWVSRTSICPSRAAEYTCRS